MGNLESTEGGPGEPPSVPLPLPPGKTPMPEPCELEERFALVLVRRAGAAAFPAAPPPHPRGSPPTPAARSTLDPLGSSGRPSRGRGGRTGRRARDLPEVQTPPPHFLRLPGPLPEFHSRDLAGGTASEAVGSPAQIRRFQIFPPS